MRATPEQIKAWISEIVSQKREEPHFDFKIEATPDKLLKHITAMYNTPGSLFGGCGYIVVGVTNQHEVQGLSDKERAACPTPDKRENALVQALAAHTSPPPAVEVMELTLDTHPDALLHVIEVPASQGSWSVIYTDRSERGFFVRRGSQSVSPKPHEIEAQQQNLIYGPLRALEQEVVALRATVTEQRRQLDHLMLEKNPAQASNAQVLRAMFNTPERTLVKTVQTEVAHYLEKHASAGNLLYSHTIPFSRLDRPQEALLLTKSDLQPLRDAFEQIEENIRPLVEMVGVLATEVPLGERKSSASMFLAVEDALHRMGNAILSTGLGPDARRLDSPSLAAMKTYAGILLLFAAATASVTQHASQQWFVLECLFGHRRMMSRINLKKTPVRLMEYWGFREHLDFLVNLYDNTHPICACVERVRDLMRRPEWLGTVIPPTEASAVTRDAEVVTSLGYIFQALAVKRTPPFVPSAWMMYLDAEEQFRTTLGIVVDPKPMRSLCVDAEHWRTGLGLLGEQMANAHLNFRFDPLRVYDMSYGLGV